MLLSAIGCARGRLKGSCLRALLSLLERATGGPVAPTLAQPRSFRRRTTRYGLHTTVTMWLAQCLSADRSCRAVVAQAKHDGVLPPAASPDTGAYCKARGALCADGVGALATQAGQTLERAVAPADLWRGRVVRVVDGTGLQLPDTPANQAAYPQPGGQAPGCGFPLLYVVALMSLATGAMLHWVSSAWRRHEQMLFAQLHALLHPGEVVLGDRAFGSFGAIAVLAARGVDCVFRVSGRRKVDFRRGTRLGRHDHLVMWDRGHTWPAWCPRDYPLPQLLPVREVRFTVDRAGFRSRRIVLVTTLVDPVAYPVEALAALYRRRWEQELWFRDIKIAMGMDVLRTRTPARVRTELAIHCLAYNCVRATMWDAHRDHAVPVARVSFTAALTVLRLDRVPLTARPRRWWQRIYPRAMHDLARDPVPDRPDRIEPRALKRRKKQYDLLNRPRAELRAALLAG